MKISFTSGVCLLSYTTTGMSSPVPMPSETAKVSDGPIKLSADTISRPTKLSENVYNCRVQPMTCPWYWPKYDKKVTQAAGYQEADHGVDGRSYMLDDRA